MEFLLVIGLICLVVIGVTVWRSYFSPTGRRIGQAHVELDQAFQMVKLETYKALKEQGVDGYAAAAITNDVFDSLWRTLKTDWRFLGGVDNRREVLATTMRACLAVVEKDHPGTIAWVAADLKPYGTDWLARD
jgi:hypothetical protein